MRVKPVLSSVVWLAALGLGCGPGATPTSAPAPATPTTPATPPTPEPAEPPPELTLDAAAYPAEYATDRAAANRKYAGKRVEVTGTASFVGRDAVGGNLTLANPDADRDAVNCSLADLDPWKSALPGQTVRVRGTVRGVYPALQVGDARIVSATGQGPPVVEATELARRFAANPEELNAAYGNKSLIVTGVVEAVERHDTGAVVASLTGKGVVPEVRCGFGVFHPADKDQNARLVQGQRVKVLVHYVGGVVAGRCTLEMGRLLPIAP